MYRIKYTNKLEERAYVHTTDGRHIIEDDDSVLMGVIADALNRLGMTPDEIPGKDFKVVKES